MTRKELIQKLESLGDEDEVVCISTWDSILYRIIEVKREENPITGNMESVIEARV